MINAICNGIAAIFQFIFNLMKPVGMMVDVIFIIIIAIGCIYWLIYEQRVNKGQTRNYLADRVEKDKD